MRAVLLAVAALLLLAPPAHADHDGDPLADGLEPLVCGQPRLADAVQQLGGSAGECRPGYDYHHSALGQEATCSGSSCSAPLHQPTPPLPPAGTPPVDLPPAGIDPIGPIPIPFLDPDTVVLEGYRGDGNDYCIRIDSADVTPPAPVCINLSGLAGEVPPFGPTPLMPYDDLGYTPPVEQGLLGTVPPADTQNVRLEVTLTAHWDEDRLSRRAANGPAEVWEPVDLLVPDEVDWWRTHGHETRLVVSWRVVDAWGDARSEDSLAVPYLGQAVAAAHRSVA